ncbi:757_t:CDS:1, partial [Dentiscutata erythropus]
MNCDNGDEVQGRRKLVNEVRHRLKPKLPNFSINLCRTEPN